MKTYISQNGEQIGPFDDDEIRNSLREGKLALGDFAWREGMQEWQTLATLYPDEAQSTSSSAVTDLPVAPASHNQEIVTVGRFPWYRKIWIHVILFILIPYIQVPLMWILKMFSFKTRIGLSVAGLILTLIYMNSDSGESVTVGSISEDISYVKLTVSELEDLEGRPEKYKSLLYGKGVEIELNVGADGIWFSGDRSVLRIGASKGGEQGARNIMVSAEPDSAIYSQIIEARPSPGDHMLVHGKITPWILSPELRRDTPALPEFDIYADQIIFTKGSESP